MMAVRPARRPLSMQPSLILYHDAEYQPATPTLAIHQYPPREVAMELCLMDSQLLRKISPQELEDGAWMKADKMTRAPNIMAMVIASNTLAQLVPTEVLKEQTIPAMAKCISVFIKIASKCHRLNNFNSLKAILAGLQCTPLYRLKLSWREVPTKRKRRFDYLCQLMSEQHNWRVYSVQLQELLDTTTPFIPFLGVLLTTTVQYHSRLEGCPRKVSGIEDYTLLEAITVRNRLDTLRSRLSTGPKSLAPWPEETARILDTSQVLCILGHSTESLSSEEDPSTHAHRPRAWSELSGLDKLHDDNEQTQSRSCEDLREAPWGEDWDQDSRHNSLDSLSISTSESSNVATPPPVSPTLATPPPVSPTLATPPPVPPTLHTPPPVSPTPATSPSVPMRERSREIIAHDRTNRLSRSSQFSIDIPQYVLRDRRRPSTLLGVLHGASVPTNLLSCYQIMALACSASMHSKAGLRDIITNSYRNTEAINYQLSHLREP